MIAALFVETHGPYYGLSDVDPWDLERDARLYAGPWPVVAHPPCERWERYWSGGPSAKTRRKLGDDNGCFAAALKSVREFGGVLEHPAHTHTPGELSIYPALIVQGVGLKRIPSAEGFVMWSKVTTAIAHGKPHGYTP